MIEYLVQQSVVVLMVALIIYIIQRVHKSKDLSFHLLELGSAVALSPLLTALIISTAAYKTIDYFVQLNWQLLWQSAIILVVSLGIDKTLHDCEKENRSFHRFLVWRSAALSPLLIALVMAVATYFNWSLYSTPQIWLRVPPSHGNVPTNLIRQTAINYPLGVSLVTGPYVFWLLLYGWRVLWGIMGPWTRSLLPYQEAIGERQAFREVCKRFGFKSRPILREVNAAVSPYTCRWLYPVVILPSLQYGLIKTPAEFKALVSHEFAHIKYHHNLIPLLQGIVAWLFPFSQLFLQMANRRLKCEMEKFADAAAVQIGGADGTILKDLLDRFRNRNGLHPPPSQSLVFADEITKERQHQDLEKPIFAKLPLATRGPWVAVASLLVAALAVPLVSLNAYHYTKAVTLQPERIYSSYTEENPTLTYATTLQAERVYSPSLAYKVELPRLAKIGHFYNHVAKVEPVLSVKLAEPQYMVEPPKFVKMPRYEVISIAPLVRPKQGGDGGEANLLPKLFPHLAGRFSLEGNTQNDPSPAEIPNSGGKTLRDLEEAPIDTTPQSQILYDSLRLPRKPSLF